MNDLPSASVRLRRALILQRDRFEQLYIGLVDALPLDPAIDRGVFRVALLTLLNSVPHWFRAGRLSLRQVTEQLLRIFGRPERRKRRRVA